MYRELQPTSLQMMGYNSTLWTIIHTRCNDSPLLTTGAGEITSPLGPSFGPHWPIVGAPWCFKRTSKRWQKFVSSGPRDATRAPKRSKNNPRRTAAVTFCYILVLVGPFLGVSGAPKGGASDDIIYVITCLAPGKPPGAKMAPKMKRGMTKQTRLNITTI